MTKGRQDTVLGSLAGLGALLSVSGLSAVGRADAVAPVEVLPTVPHAKLVRVAAFSPDIARASAQVSSLIRTFGYPCERITYVTPMREGGPLYGVTCRTRSASQVHYLVNFQDGYITRLRS